MSIIGHLMLLAEDEFDALRVDPSRVLDIVLSAHSQPDRRVLEYAQNVDEIYAFHYAFSGRTAWAEEPGEWPLLSVR